MLLRQVHSFSEGQHCSDSPVVEFILPKSQGDFFLWHKFDQTKNPEKALDVYGTCTVPMFGHFFLW